jgi:Flp pilus assembly protein TadB
MSKVVFWIVLIFAVLFVLRLINAAKARRRRDAFRQNDPNIKPIADAMVRCVRCGVFLPQADAQAAPGGFVCGDPSCTQRH